MSLEKDPLQQTRNNTRKWFLLEIRYDYFEKCGSWNVNDIV